MPKAHGVKVGHYDGLAIRVLACDTDLTKMKSNVTRGYYGRSIGLYGWYENKFCLKFLKGHTPKMRLNTAIQFIPISFILDNRLQIDLDVNGCEPVPELIAYVFWKDAKTSYEPTKVSFFSLDLQLAPNATNPASLRLAATHLSIQYCVEWNTPNIVSRLNSATATVLWEGRTSCMPGRMTRTRVTRH